MGMGFRLNLKWDFPINCHTLTNSPSRLSTSSSSVQGKEAPLDSTRFSFLSVTSEDCQTLYKDPFKPLACSSGSLQTFENDYVEMEDMKMNIGKCSHVDLFKIVNASEAPTAKDKSVSLASVQASKASQFSLLLENLDILEEMFADSDMERLERDIMVQLGRLGALKVFHICLSRTLKTSTYFDLFSNPTEHVSDKTNGTVDDHLDKVVRSGKKEERKSKRERALRKADKIYAVSLPSKTIRRGPGRPGVSTAKRQLNSRSRRLMNAKNEAEMSKGVKVVANLERIRATLEEEIGHVASLSNWAEAAGVDEKVLQKQLQFGWCCRDELLRSTHSLVLYIARNYRGMGVAFEDILQAGNLGVLQGAERFDHTKGYRFSTYVQYWIRKSMSTLVARHARGIKVPFTLNRVIGQIQKARKALYKSHGRYPDDNEIAKFTGLSLAKIKSAGNCLRVVGSTDQTFQGCWGATILEFTPDTSIESPEEGFMRQCKRRDIHSLLKGLDPRERQILVLRYGFEKQQRKSLEEIGKLFNVSKEWIRKLEKTALTKLRDQEISQNLTHYVDF